MSRLSKLYEAMETLRKEGLPVGGELERKANELEENIIKKEILPVLTKTIEPALQPVQRELVLVVDYKPGEPLSVHLSRKSNITAELADAKEMKLDDAAVHSTHALTNPSQTKAPASDLEIEFPDGTVIAESKATETMIKAVQKIGVMRVRRVVEELNLKFCKVPVISNRRDSKYGRSQKDLGGGWLLITHSNNEMKKAFFEKVSDALHLGLKVRIKK